MKKEKNINNGAKASYPTTGMFIILLITLWALNLADTFQTIFLKESGHLAQEANYFIDFFLSKSTLAFIAAKILALILISSVLIRGWIDKKGIKLGAAHYPREAVRNSIYFMLVAGVIYYTIIVIFPFTALLLSGSFQPLD